MLKVCRFLFACAVLLAIAVCSLAGVVIWRFDRGLPDHQQRAHYQPAIMTRVYAGDGRPVAEYAIERRVFVPIAAIPKRVINAFLSAEDKSFYSHHGIEVMSMVRAAITNVGRLRANHRPIGAFRALPTQRRRCGQAG
jgi:penicillin-binding protein 1A